MRRRQGLERDTLAGGLVGFRRVKWIGSTEESGGQSRSTVGHLELKWGEMVVKASEDGHL
jgi:hypothetical protein